MKNVQWETKFGTVLQMADQLMRDGNEKLDLSDKAVWGLASWIGYEIESELKTAAWCNDDDRTGGIEARTLNEWIEHGFTLEHNPDWSGPQLMAAYACYLVSDTEQCLDDLPAPFEIMGELSEDETTDCRALQKSIYSMSGWRRDEIIDHCASNIIEAMEACHYGRLLIGKTIAPDEEWLAEFARKNASERARKAANASHAEDNEIAERIKSWYAENHRLYRSMDKAAEAVTRLEPVAFKTARKHIGTAAKNLPSARRE